MGRTAISEHQEKWTLVGAIARRAELESELRVVNDYLGTRGAGVQAVAVKRGRKPGKSAKVSSVKRRRRPMSSQARLEVSRRMKRYWAGRRAAAK